MAKTCWQVNWVAVANTSLMKINLQVILVRVTEKSVLGEGFAGDGGRSG